MRRFRGTFTKMSHNVYATIDTTIGIETFTISEIFPTKHDA
jgi:hypothetical protein